MTPPPMLPPMAGAAAGGSGAGSRNGDRRRWNGEHDSRTSEIVIQPLDGGRWASFDPDSGSLRAIPAATGPVGGVLGYFGDVLAVFYRREGRLTLRLGSNEFDLDAPTVGVGWEHVDQRHARFRVHVDGQPVVDFPYPLNGGGTDLGLIVRDVMADPRQCASVFN